jgi:hypothetical protein
MKVLFLIDMVIVMWHTLKLNLKAWWTRRHPTPPPYSKIESVEIPETPLEKGVYVKQVEDRWRKAFCSFDSNPSPPEAPIKDAFMATVVDHFYGKPPQYSCRGSQRKDLIDKT